MSKSKVPIVAIVGRANVGKSSLFNAVLKRREAIVAREAGTTRDSIFALASYYNQDFWIVDTAGIKDPEDDFELSIQDQITEAAAAADLIWVVVEAGQIINDEDRRVAKLALKTQKPVILVASKSDKASKNLAERILYLKKLGVKQIAPISSTQNYGIGELLEKTVSHIPKAKQKPSRNKIKLAILGRPNVGKSSLFNALVKKQQAIVADKAGTTRDINRQTIGYHERDIEIMDTAGIRRSGKIEVGIERFSVIRALSAIEEADVCLLLMDANELNVAVDQKIAGMVKDAGKGLVLVVSKWDSVEDKTAYTLDSLTPRIKHNFEFVPWAPLIITSSITGQNLTKIFELATQISGRRELRIKTPELNRWLGQSLDKHPPAGLKNTQPKLKYMVQEFDAGMPSFKIFGRDCRFLHWSYKRFLERELRLKYDFVGTPIKFWFIDSLANKANKVVKSED